MRNPIGRMASVLLRAIEDGIRRDRAARKAEPTHTASPLIVIPIPRWRTYFTLGVIVTAFILLAFRAFWLQVVTSDFLQGQGEARYARTLSIAGTRGEILDRNGVVATRA